MTRSLVHFRVVRWLGALALALVLLAPLRAAAAPDAFLGVNDNPVFVPCGAGDGTTYVLGWSSGDDDIRPDLYLKEGDAPERWIPNLTPTGKMVMGAKIGRKDTLILYTPKRHVETLARLEITAERSPLCIVNQPAPPNIVQQTRITNFSATWEYADVNPDYTGPDTSLDHTGIGGVPVIVIRYDSDETVAPTVTLGLGEPRDNGTWPQGATVAPPLVPFPVPGQIGHLEMTLYPGYTQYQKFADYTPFSHPPFGLLKDDGSGDLIEFSFNNFDQVWASISVPGSAPFVHKLL
jgi:hypothetical protein